MSPATLCRLGGDRTLSAAGAGPRPAVAVAHAVAWCVRPARRCSSHLAAATPGGKDSSSGPSAPKESNFDADAPPGFWDSPTAGYLSIGVGVGAAVAFLSLLITLAKPVIETTVDAFPVRGGERTEAGAGVTRQ